jgi:hypothetical protein
MLSVEKKSWTTYQVKVFTSCSRRKDKALGLRQTVTRHRESPATNREVNLWMH